MIVPGEGITTRYYAVPDPVDPAKVSYWYEPRRGKLAGTLQPWPPNRNHWGSLFHRDIPEGLTEAQRRAFTDDYFRRVRQAREDISGIIAADPAAAALRFSRYCVCCCSCGKALTADRSSVYGIGPECRKGVAPQVLSRLIERTKQIYRESELLRADISPASTANAS